MVSLTSCAQSDIGKKRSNNEDALFMSDDLKLFMVADGMGGHRGGDKASRIAIDVAAATFTNETNLGASFKSALESAFIAAAKAVHEQGSKNPELKGMGTTLSAIAINDHQGFIAHIGDSRIYCIRDGNIHQLTSDHSLVNEQVQAGIMTQDEARVSPLRNIITRAIGSDENAKADCFTIGIHKDDLFLLCTDGLNNMLTDNEILNIVTSHPPKAAVQNLIDEANRKGGDDNITVTIINVG